MSARQGHKRTAPREAARSSDLSAIVNALPQPIVAVDRDNRVVFANSAAEQFFRSSLSMQPGSALAAHLPADSPLFALIQQVRQRNQSISEHQVSLETPKIGLQEVTIDAAPLSEDPSVVVIALREGAIARRIDQQLVHRNAARSVTAMGALLAHEVKNPLSGIRGAAQLLEADVPPAGRELTRLICDEADRIVGLVDDMEMFSDQRPIAKEGVNIHEVLDHVRRLVEAGTGSGIHFLREFDPSLPLVYGHRDLLIQAFLNLVKNAAEALEGRGEIKGEITMRTQYLQGIRLAVNGPQYGHEVPLAISICDNGGGIAPSLHSNLFDPFVTSKSGGKGLGLALVAKVVDDHGGVIECDSRPGHTEFRVLLPMMPKAPSSRRRKPKSKGEG